MVVKTIRKRIPIIVLFFLIFPILLNQQVIAASTASTGVNFSASKYNLSASVSTPYLNNVTVNITLTGINMTVINSTYSSGAVYVKYIVLTYDFGSKFFDMNETKLFEYDNRTYEAENFSRVLYFPIREIGKYTLNVTVCFTARVFFITLDIIKSVNLPISVETGSQQVSINLSPESLNGWMSPLDTILLSVVISAIVVIVENFVLLKIYKRKRK